MANAETTTRQEHLEWCKKRAIKYIDAGDLNQAFVSFGSDVKKHPDTEDIGKIIAMLGTPLFFAGHLNTPEKMQKHIVGYN